MTEAELKKENAALKKEVKALRASIDEATASLAKVQEFFDLVRVKQMTLVLKPIPLKKKKAAKKRHR